jgi:hypothetical protein
MQSILPLSLPPSPFLSFVGLIKSDYAVFPAPAAVERLLEYTTEVLRGKGYLTRRTTAVQEQLICLFVRFYFIDLGIFFLRYLLSRTIVARSNRYIHPHLQCYL